MKWNYAGLELFGDKEDIANVSLMNGVAGSGGSWYWDYLDFKLTCLLLYINKFTFQVPTLPKPHLHISHSNHLSNLL